MPYTDSTKQILVAAFQKSVNNDGQVQLLSVTVSHQRAVYLALNALGFQGPTLLVFTAQNLCDHFTEFAGFLAEFQCHPVFLRQPIVMRITVQELTAY